MTDELKKEMADMKQLMSQSTMGKAPGVQAFRTAHTSRTCVQLLNSL